MDYVKTGKLIQEARKEKGLTQLQLADMLGVTDKAISKWERGKSFPDVAMLKPVGEALDLSVVELLDGERREAEPLTREEAGETAIKGIQTYVSESQRRQRLEKMIVILVLVIALSAFGIWKHSHRPVNFSEDVFDFGAAGVQTENSDTDTDGFVLDLNGGRYDDLVRERIKVLLAKETGYMQEVSSLPESQEWVYLNEPGNRDKTMVSFSPGGYIDHRSGKYYTCAFADSLFYDLQSILLNYYEESSADYQYEGKQVYQYQGRKLVIEDPPHSPTEELIVDYFHGRLKEDFRPEFPDAYISETRIQSIKWILPEDCDEYELYSIEKEIAYQELYDYRIYEVVTNMTYTEALRNLGPQAKEGQQTYLLLLGKRSSDPEFSVCYVRNTAIGG